MSNINVNAYCETHGVSKQTSMDLQQAIGGTFQLPDGRSFWVDAVTVREIMSRIVPVIGAALETSGRVARNSTPPETRAAVPMSETTPVSETDGAAISERVERPAPVDKLWTDADD
ncbi:hypothetical protein [Neorhizobium sp. DAR64872/K0K18]|uniref:hypothetical protein n=1 Tax=Neorhizobium sp. DAR64872/K0K18 TaxID=3421958 RepID=UPI003D290C79